MDLAGMDLGQAPEIKRITTPAAPDFGLIFNSSPNALLIVLPDAPVFTMLAASNAYLVVSGLKREQLVGRGVFEVFPDNPDESEADGVGKLLASFQRAMETRAPDRMPLQRYDVQRPPEDGGGFEERYWSALNTPVLGPNSEVDYLLHSVEELTAKVQAEKRERSAQAELLSRETRLHQLGDSNTFGLLSGDLEGGLSYMNGNLQNMVLYTQDEVAAGLVRWDQLTPPEFHHLDEDAVRQLRSVGMAEPYEKEFVAKDGRRIPILIGASLVATVDGSTEVVAYVVDLTARKKGERDAFLVRLDEAMRALTDPEDIVQTASQMLVEHLRVDRCLYCFFDQDGEHFSMLSDYTREGVASLAGRDSLSQFGVGLAELFRDNLPSILPDVGDYGYSKEVREVYLQAGIAAHISIPLKKAGRVVASLAVHQQVERQWLPEEVELLQMVASRCWEAVERTRVTYELRKSEQRLRLAQKAARIGSFEWLAKEATIVWTPELEALYGLPEGGFGGTLAEWRKRIVADDEGAVLAGIRECIRRRSPEYSCEFRAAIPDGSIRWLRSTAQVFYNDSGEPVRMIGVNIDVEEEKRTEAQLRQQWHTFDTALSHTPDFTYIFSLAGRFTYVNKALLALLQKSLPEVIGKNFWELDYPPELAERLQNQVQRVIRTKEMLRDETEFTAPTGEIGFYEYIFVPVFADDGTVEAVAGSTRDVTERNRAERLVQEDRRRWRELLYQAPAAIAVLRGPDHCFEWMNPMYLQLIGRPKAESLIGKAAREALPEIAPQGYAAMLDRVFQTGEPHAAPEEFVMLGDQATGLRGRYVNFVCLATRDSAGQIDGTFIHCTDVTALVLIRNQVEESEKRFRTLVDSATDHAIFGLDLDGRVMNWNSGAERLLGFTDEEILGHSGAKIFTPEDQHSGAPEHELVEAHYKGRSSGERWHLRRDGTRFWGSGTVTPVLNKEGKVEGFVKVLQDRTREWFAAEKLRENEEQLRIALDTARLGSWSLDMTTGELDCSARCLANFGWPEGKFTYNDLRALVLPEDRERMQQAVDRAIRERTDYEAEYRIIRPNGELAWIVASGRVLNSDGTARQMVGVTLDITQRKQAEDALRESEERFRQLADSMPQMVWTAQPDGKIDYYNERWYEFTGLDRSVMGDGSWGPILHPDDLQRVYSRWYASVESGEPFQSESRFWDRHESRWRWFIGQARPARAASGQILKWFGTCTDIDEQKATQEAVLQASKLESIGLLAGGVAHDFNNLLVGIMGGASFALDTVPVSNPAYPLLKGVVEASERAAHLTRQMLAYAGKGRFVVEDVDLSVIAAETRELVKASIPQSVNVELQFAENLPTVLTDPGQMQQVAMNLIINAAEAVGENRSGLVSIRTRAEQVMPGGARRDVTGHALPAGLYAVLEVQDTGSGVDEAILAKIFDPFFTTKFTGRGLGLAAVLGLVRSNQGGIEVDTAPGKGSTFRVLLPARYTAEPAPRTEPSVGTSASGKGNVLVIDDESIVRKVAHASLLKSGYGATLAESGETGLEAIRNDPGINLVLLDMSMPGMSGRQVLEAIHAIRPALPVIICSGYSEGEIHRQFLGLEIAGALQKPFTASQLVNRVRSVLEGTPVSR